MAEVELSRQLSPRRLSQVLSTYVGGQCNKLVTVVGHQYITLTVYIYRYVQHGGYDYEAPHCVCLSTAAETCLAQQLPTVVVTLTLTLTLTVRRTAKSLLAAGKASRVPAASY